MSKYSVDFSNETEVRASLLREIFLHFPDATLEANARFSGRFVVIETLLEVMTNLVPDPVKKSFFERHLKAAREADDEDLAVALQKHLREIKSEEKKPEKIVSNSSSSSQNLSSQEELTILMSALEKAAISNPKSTQSLVQILRLIDETNVNQQTSHHWTPLHFAALFGTVENVRDLIAKGADVNAVTYSGNGALSLALKGAGNRENIVGELLTHNLTTQSFGEGLVTAIEFGKTKATELILNCRNFSEDFVVLPKEKKDEFFNNLRKIANRREKEGKDSSAVKAAIKKCEEKLTPPKPSKKFLKKAQSVVESNANEEEISPPPPPTAEEEASKIFWEQYLERRKARRQIKSCEITESGSLLNPAAEPFVPKSPGKDGAGKT